tara:strand:- start:7238 stop:7483 length:246 start_codon:yes stop_codon:yes gene_type:complete
MSKHSKIGNVDYDPNNDMVLDKKPDGDVDVKYKGSQMGFDNYVDEIEERATRHSQGKSITKNTIGSFAGFGKGTLKKPYKQ